MTEATLPGDAAPLRRPRFIALRKRLPAIGTALAALFMAAWVLIPFYFLFLLAIQTKSESLSVPPVWFPAPDFSNFSEIFSHAFSGEPASRPSDLIFPGIVNSAIVATFVALINVVAGSLAAYAFARYRFRGSVAVPVAMIGTQIVPIFALLVPYYVVFRELGLTNSLTGIVVADLSFTLPFTVWLLRGYVQGIPADIDRQARVDGCTRWGVFWRVILPLIRVGLLSVGLFAFLISWNDFLFPLVLNSNEGSIMVQPAIAGLYNIREQSLGLMAAGTLLAAIPTLLIAVVSQRFLVRGLLGGATKQ